MSTFERIATSTPLNRTAAVVTSGGDADPELTPDQKRENLVSLVNKIQRAIDAASDPEYKKRLGKRKEEVKAAITALKLKRPPEPDFPRMFLELSRELLPFAMYRLIREAAFKRLDEKRSQGEVVK